MESRFIDLECKIKVEQVLDYFKSNPNYKVLNNVVLQGDSYKAEIDHIVISTFGIFIIERNKGKGVISGEEFSNKWKQRVGFKKIEIENSIQKNKRQVIALQDFLNNNYSKIEPFIIPLVVFTDYQAKIKVDHESVIKLEDLRKTIISYNTELINKSDLWNIHDILLREK